MAEDPEYTCTYLNLDTKTCFNPFSDYMAKTCVPCPKYELRDGLVYGISKQVTLDDLI